MRALLLLLLILAACTPHPVEPTAPPFAEVREIGGVIAADTVLNGDYLLVSDLLVPAGSRLTIRAGSTIMVRAAETTKIDPEYLSSLTEILVRGELRIEGTGDAPVKIRPERAADNGDPAWAGLLIDRAEAVQIRSVRISQAETGLLLNAADAEVDSAVLIGNRYGMIVQGGVPRIERCQIVDGESGLYLWQGTTAIVRDSLIRGQAEEGVYIDRDSRPQLRGNLSQQNDFGLVATALLPASALNLTGNRVAWQPLAGEQL